MFTIQCPTQRAEEPALYLLTSAEISKSNINKPCHPERSEGSLALTFRPGVESKTFESLASWLAFRCGAPLTTTGQRARILILRLSLELDRNLAIHRPVLTWIRRRRIFPADD
jgi:hypothetical protein